MSYSYESAVLAETRTADCLGIVFCSPTLGPYIPDPFSWQLGLGLVSYSILCVYILSLYRGLSTTFHFYNFKIFHPNSAQMNYSIRIVLLAGLFLSLFACVAVESVRAQGIGVRLGAGINNDIDFASSLGFSIGGDLLWAVDDDGLLYFSCEYTSFGLDEEQASDAIVGHGSPDRVTITGSGPRLFSMVNGMRFRLHDKLDEPSVLILGGLGATFILGPDFTATLGSFEQDYERDLLYSFSGMLALGFDYPIIGENVAMISQLEMPVNFIGNIEGKGVHIPGVFFSLGIEYRVEN